MHVSAREVRVIYIFYTSTFLVSQAAQQDNSQPVLLSLSLHPPKPVVENNATELSQILASNSGNASKGRPLGHNQPPEK